MTTFLCIFLITHTISLSIALGAAHVHRVESDGKRAALSDVLGHAKWMTGVALGIAVAPELTGGLTRLVHVWLQG